MSNNNYETTNQALNYNDTRLFAIESRINTALAPTASVSLIGISPSAIRSWLKKKKRPEIKTDDTSFNGKYIFNADGETIERAIMPKTLQAIYEKLVGDGGQYYSSVEAFIEDIATAREESSQGRDLASAKKTSRNSHALSTLNRSAPREWSTSVTFRASTKTTNKTKTSIGEDFLAEHLRRLGDTLFYVFDHAHTFRDGTVGRVLAIPMSGPDEIATDDDFWSAFEDEFEPLLWGYAEKIMSICYKYGNDVVKDQHGNKVPASWDQGINFEKELAEAAPAFVLATTHLQRYYTEDKKTGEVIWTRDVFLWNTSRDDVPNFCSNGMRKHFKKDLLQHIPYDRIKEVRVFTNDQNDSEAIHRLPPIPKINTDMTERPTLAAYGCPTWNNFLHTPDAKGVIRHKFTDPVMSELRLAKFITSVIHADDHSRQLFALFGDGNDGKTIILNAIQAILGSALSQGSLHDDQLGKNFSFQNQLWKRLIVFEDISKTRDFMDDDTIKSITGNNANIQVDIKYKAPVNWRPSGCKIAMTANYGTTLSIPAQITRLLPIVCYPNYDRRSKLDPEEVKRAMVKEGANLIRWAFDLCWYYSTLRCPNEFIIKDGTTTTEANPNFGERCPLFDGIAHDNIPADPNVIGAKLPFIGMSLSVVTDKAFDDWMNGLISDFPAPDMKDKDKLAFNKQMFESTTRAPKSIEPFIKINAKYTEDDTTAEMTETLVDVLFESGTEDDVVFNDDVAKTVQEISEGKDQTPNAYRLLKRIGIDASKPWKDVSRSAEWRGVLAALALKVPDSIERPRCLKIGDKWITKRGRSHLKLRSAGEIERLLKEQSAKTTSADSLSFGD